MRNLDSNPREATFEELDRPFTQSEIQKAINTLASNKACGQDCIINEYFKHTSTVLLSPLEKLFNKILNSGGFPAQWSVGVIVPVHKKGEINDPNNYRGITLVSCFSKLFTSVLNQRLKQWAVDNDTITDAQFGFKANHSTVDAVFILKYLIDKHLQAKKKLYCAFIDLKKAFDSISRSSLWYKLINSGIDGKLLKLIRSMYQKVKLRVKGLNSLTNLLDCDVGLLQGEIMSPILFSIFLNDLEMQLSDNDNDGITIDQRSLYLLLFADDAAIFSETREGLQKSLDNLEIYCNKWNLTVNVDKTKVMVFHKGGILAQNEHWTYNNQELEIVNTFNYLGVVLSSGGSFIPAAKALADKALKSMNGLFECINSTKPPVKIKLNLFDSLVASILHYGCEVWGFISAECIERVHRKFCKWILKVKMSTNNYALYKELGRYPLSIVRQVRIVKYWFKLISDSNSNCILKSVYQCMVSQTENNNNQLLWSTKVKQLLQRNGFGEVWLFPDSVNVRVFLNILKTRLIDNYLIELREGLRASSSLTVFKELNETFELATYLNVLCNDRYRTSLAKLRLSSHSLAIETGRHTGVPRNERKCTFCRSDEIEDEYHFIISCSFYNEIRKVYIPKYYISRPSMFKFIELLNCSSVKILKNLAIYVIKALEIRNAVNIVVEVQ